MAQRQILLLEDVEGLGNKGEIVTNVKPGYLRNFLLPKLRRAKGEAPKALAKIATDSMARLQEELRKARAEQAKKDLKESQELAKHIESVKLSTRVKVNPEGQMYGAVAATDIVELLAQSGITVDRKQIITKPIKESGVHTISFKLKEGVTATCELTIIPEGVKAKGIENVVRAIEPEKAPEAEVAEEPTTDDEEQS